MIPLIDQSGFQHRYSSRNLIAALQKGAGHFMRVPSFTKLAQLFVPFCKRGIEKPLLGKVFLPQHQTRQQKRTPGSHKHAPAHSQFWKSCSAKSSNQPTATWQPGCLASSRAGNGAGQYCDRRDSTFSGNFLSFPILLLPVLHYFPRCSGLPMDVLF